MKKIEVIMDNGGGITIQLARYTHYYNDPEHAARDYKSIINGADPIRDGWDGNEPGCRLEYDAEQVRNGGYIWLTPQNIADRDYEDWGYNTQQFYDALDALYR